MNFIDPKIENYAIEKSNTPSDLANELELYTRENIEMSMMLIGKMEASFITFLIQSLGAKNILEIGTFTGYSSLIMAESSELIDEIHTIDINEKTTELAKSYWKRSPHGNKIKAHLGQALEIIPQIEKSFDFVFIDADKVNYLNYLKRSLEKLNEGGVILIDNVLWGGSVIEDNVDDSTRAIQEVNDYIKNSNELYGTLVPIRDGLFLVRKN